MTYQTPEYRTDTVHRLVRRFREARQVILTTHLNADGDGAGSEAALASWLKAHEVEVAIVNPTRFPESFEFLLDDPTLVAQAGSVRADELCASADLAVVLDTGETSRIGRVKPMIEHLETVVIDHHLQSTSPIEGDVLRDEKACATGELVYDLVAAAGGPWLPSVAQGIYVAILTDTGSFRFANSTPAAHRISADLIDRGVDPEATYRQVYGHFPPRRMQVLAAALGELEVDDHGDVAWMTVPREAYESSGATAEDLDGFVDYPRSIAGVEVGLLFRTTATGDTKISLRSNGLVDVNEVAREFGGGGHAMASGALIRGPVAEVRERVVATVRRAVKKARGRGARPTRRGIGVALD